jgi:hypothetical protein
LTPYRELINPGMLGWLIQNRVDAETYEPQNLVLALEETRQKSLSFFEALSSHIGGTGDVAALADAVKQDIESLLTIAMLKKKSALQTPSKKDFVEILFTGYEKTPGLEKGSQQIWSQLFFSIFNSQLGKIAARDDSPAQSRIWLDELLLAKVDKETLQAFGMDGQTASRSLELQRVLISNQEWFNEKSTPQQLHQQLISAWLEDQAARIFLQVHPYQDVLWFNRESFIELTWWTCAFEFVLLRSGQKTPKRTDKAIQIINEVFNLLLNTMEGSDYQIDKLAGALKNNAG